jgi:hypothetical protein
MRAKTSDLTRRGHLIVGMSQIGLDLAVSQDEAYLFPERGHIWFFAPTCQVKILDNLLCFSVL